MSAGATVASIVSAQRANRQKVLNPLSEEQAALILNDTWYIFNLRKNHPPVTVHRSWGGVTVPCCPQDEEYSVTAVHGRIEKCDAGIENTFTEQVTTARQAAEDIMHWFNDDCPTLQTNPGMRSFNGVFISNKPEPSKQELAEAWRRMKAYDHALIAEADNLWGVEATKKNVSQPMREAAARQGVHKPWLYEMPGAVAACFACGTEIKQSVILCPECKVVQPGKEAEARKHFPEKFAHEKLNASSPK